MIAFFLKYLLRESYEKAWEAFLNANKGTTWINSLINEARCHFIEAVVVSLGGAGG